MNDTVSKLAKQFSEITAQVRALEAHLELFRREGAAVEADLPQSPSPITSTGPLEDGPSFIWRAPLETSCRRPEPEPEPEPEPQEGSTAASSGYGSTAASSGNGSKATQKDGAAGIAAATGNDVVVQAGERGLLIATWWDASAKRYRAVVGEVGVDGIEAGVDYLVKGGKLTKV